MTHFSVFAKNDYEKWQQGLYVADTQDGFNLVSWKDAYKRSMSIAKVDETDDDDGDEYVSEVAHPWIFIVQKHIYMQNHEIERDDDFKITKSCEDAISKIKPKKSQSPVVGAFSRFEAAYSIMSGRTVQLAEAV